MPGERRAVPCKRCERPLTDPLSRMLRLGPECRAVEFATRGFAVQQDALPGLDVTPGP